MYFGKVIQASTLLLILFQQTICYNILAVFNMPSKSIHLAAVAMVHILVERGHNVTLVTSYSDDVKQSENFTHVYLEDPVKLIDQTIFNFFDFQPNPYLLYKELETMGISNCEATFTDPAFKRLIKSRKNFDLLIVDPYMSDSLLYLSVYYDIPVIIYSCFHSSYAMNHYVGNHEPPSYIPNIFLEYPREMNFFQRLDNSFVFLLNEYFRKFYSLPSHDKIVKDFFPDAPHISQYHHKASVVLYNGDISLTGSMPRTPGMIDVGGFHIRKPKPLPENLNEIMNNAKNGVILFSLGSNVKSSQMPRARVQEILEVFSKLKETIIWKWEDEDLPGRPSNVIIRKWLPQTDILAHKNTKLFITHGGLHSLLETVHYSVPCVSISVFMDQAANSYRAAQLGFVEWIKYEDFTKEKFELALQKTLNDPSYRQAVKARSQIMHDKPMTPQESVAFWVEYVVRHRGAKHLQVGGMNLHWYQYILLDVVLFTITCLILVIIIIKVAIKSLISMICSRVSKSKEKKN